MQRLYEMINGIVVYSAATNFSKSCKLANSIFNRIGLKHAAIYEKLQLLHIALQITNIHEYNQQCINAISSASTGSSIQYSFFSLFLIIYQST